MKCASTSAAPAAESFAPKSMRVLGTSLLLFDQSILLACIAEHNEMSNPMKRMGFKSVICSSLALRVANGLISASSVRDLDT